MDIQDMPIKHGYLATPHTQIILKRTWQRRYCALYGASSYAVQRAELFESEEAFTRNATTSKLIALNDCVKVVQVAQKSQPNVFEVTTKTQLLQFSTSTTQELAEWVQAFQTVAFGIQRRDSGNLNKSSDSLVFSEEQEENQIYCSLTNVPELMFLVKVVDTQTSEICGLHGQYQLVVGPYHLSLREEQPTASAPPKALFIWQYHHIRRYGRTADVFTFEAGRMCRSGEGTFSFETPHANALFHSAQVRMRAIKDGDAPKCLGNGNADSPPMATSQKGPKTAPFAKPPRKAKPVSPLSSIDQQSSNLMTMQSVEFTRYESSHHQRKAKTPPIDLLTNSIHDKSTVSPVPLLSPRRVAEPVYAALETREEAWKTFAHEKDNFHDESIKGPRGIYDFFHSPVTTSPMSSSFPSSIFQQRAMSTSSESSKPAIVALPKSHTKNNNGYDYLLQFPPQKSIKEKTPIETSPDEGHIYHRLKSTSSSTCTSPTVEAEEFPPAIGDNSPESTNSKVTDRSIDHISHNDEVYAVISKPLKLPKSIAMLEF